MSGDYHGDAEPMEVEDDCGALVGPDSVGSGTAPCGQAGHWGPGAQSAFPALPSTHIPHHWVNMMPGTSVLAVVVEPDTEEYVKIAFQFHASLTFPDADIMRVFRIQNPFLWQHYMLKQQEMLAENSGREVAERHLFHGTRVTNIDAICRKGFDWRVCGRHGTMYGQGCYFARDSRYSHRYSPKSSDPRDSSEILQSAVMPPSQPQSQGAVCSPSSTATTQGSGSSFTPAFGATATHHSACSFPAPRQQDGYVMSDFQLPQPECGFPGTLQRDGYANPASGFAAVQSLNTHCFGSGTPTWQQGPFPPQGQFSPHPAQQSCSQRTSSWPSQQSSATHKWPSGLHHMFYARVLVGNVVRGHAEYRRPPAIQHGNPLSKHYDSCVDFTGDPKIFVVFDSNQTYPEYIIEYKYSGKIT